MYPLKNLEMKIEDDKTLYRRPFTWMKKKYHKSLRQLDRLHYNSLSTKMYRSRQDGEPSTKLQPSDAPDFLISISDDDDQLNSSLNSED